MDLFKSLDGEIFIFHTGKEPFQLDRHIDLTRMTAEEIRKLRLINVDFNETEHGLNTFDEVLEHMKNRCILNLDRSKSGTTPSCQWRECWSFCRH